MSAFKLIFDLESHFKYSVSVYNFHTYFSRVLKLKNVNFKTFDLRPCRQLLNYDNYVLF